MENDKEMIKSSVVYDDTKTNGGDNTANTANVDADLFQQENVDGEEEEPDFE